MKAFRCDLCRRYFLGGPDGNALLSPKRGDTTNYDLCQTCLSKLHRVIRDGGTPNDKE